LLDEIINKSDNTKKIEEINYNFLTYRKPMIFGGKNGVEINNKIQYENTVTIIEKWLQFPIKDITVFRFFSYLKELSEQNKKK